MNEPVQMPEQANVLQLIGDIFATRPDELQCDEARLQMEICAEIGVKEPQAKQEYPMLFHHFRFCYDCATEYRMLRELVELETDNQQKWVAPSLPKEFRQPGESWTQKLFNILFPGFPLVPASAALRGGARLNRMPVTVSFDDGPIQIELDVQNSSQNPDLRTLFCTVTYTGSSDEDDFVGATLGLEMESTGEVEQKLLLNESGEVTFEEVPSGRYLLRLQLPDAVYVIEEIEIP